VPEKTMCTHIFIFISIFFLYKKGDFKLKIKVLGDKKKKKKEKRNKKTIADETDRKICWTRERISFKYVFFFKKKSTIPFSFEGT
jgi:hypothetical protein